jgi:hypothetical protein
MAWLISKALYDSWPCSQEQAVESLEGTCLDGKQSAQSSGSHTQLAYLQPDKMTAFSRLSRFGMTFKPLTADRGADLLTWFREDFLAKTYLVQEREPELMEVDQVCGSTWQELSVRYDLNSHSWKTVNTLFPEVLQSSSVTLPRSGIAVDGMCFMLPPWVQNTYDRDYSYLPTPTCHNAKEGAYPAEYTRNTPTLATHAGGKINPEWQEHLMGFPAGWTDLRPVGMRKFQSWLQQHGKY